MNQDRGNNISDLVLEAARAGVAQAIERHRRLGESIVVSHHGEIVEVSAEDIPAFLRMVDEESESAEATASAN